MLVGTPVWPGRRDGLGYSFPLGLCRAEGSGENKAGAVAARSCEDIRAFLVLSKGRRGLRRRDGRVHTSVSLDSWPPCALRLLLMFHERTSSLRAGQATAVVQCPVSQQVAVRYTVSLPSWQGETICPLWT